MSPNLNASAKAVEGAAKNMGTIAAVFTKIASIFSSIAHYLGAFKGGLVNLGLTSGQSNIIILIVVLIAFLFLLKFLGALTKVLIIVLVIWVLISIIGLI